MTFEEACPSEDTPAHDSPGLSFPVVGIGASAGGLEAVSELLSALPAAPGMAFLLVQHLDPQHESLLSEILANKTSLSVAEVEDGITVEPNHLYVIAPNASLTIADARLHLTGREGLPRPHSPIDVLLQSLADDQGANAIGVILSGSGSDGARGIEAISAAGGVTFAQNPASARFASMPKAAVATRCVDFVLAPPAIAEALVRIGRRQPPTGQAEDATGTAAAADEDSLKLIFRRLRADCGVDFVHYKRNTINRRIARRMRLHAIEDLSVYADFLQDTPREVQALTQDLLIRVTRFFRNPATFKRLAERIFPRLMEDRAPTDPLRIWVPGCASGEEVYSIAISLLEFLSERATVTQPQIFGTDVSDVAIDQARTGLFHENIAGNVSAERLKRFFVKRDSHYQIAPPVRDICVFARQDVTCDPPLSQLDLVSCQNLLIYLDVVLQRQVIPLFHYALKPQGFLVLGPSEAVGAFTDLFALIDKRCKIYQRLAVAGRVRQQFRASPRTVPKVRADRPTGAQPPPISDVERLQRDVEKLLLARYAPPCVVIDEELHTIYFHGETSRYLEHAHGPASLNLKTLARPWLIVELAAAIRQAREDVAPVRRQMRTVAADKEGAEVSLTVIPLMLPDDTVFHYLIVFEPSPSGAAETGPAGWWPPWRRWVSGRDSAPQEEEKSRQIERLQHELQSTRDYLQVITRQHEDAVEELKSAHEELLSANEEFQSTNEELETAKEELQSTNEELTTTNDELRHRNLELGDLNEALTQSRDYAQAIIETLREPLLVLDADLRVCRANDAYYSCFATTPAQTEGQLLYDLGNGQWNIPRLRTMLEKALFENTEFRDFEVTHTFADIGEKTMLLNARKLSGDSQRPNLILLVIDDVSVRLQMERAIHAEKERYRITLASIGEGVITTNARGEVEYMNGGAERYTGWNSADARGRPLSEVFTVVDNDTGQALGDVAEIATVHRRDEAAVTQWRLLHRDGETSPIDAVVAPLHDSRGETAGVVLTFRDVTPSHRLAQQLSHQATHDALTGLVNRQEFERRLRRVIASAGPQDEHVLLYLDLDQFKLVNDSCGHSGGDELLTQVTAVLCAHMRSRDTLARLGGDEFGALLEHCSLEDALRIAENLRRSVQDFRFAWRGAHFKLGISIGLASVKEAGDTFEQVLGAADTACFAAKDSGRNRVHVFESDDRAMAQRRGDMKWIPRIQEAVSDGRFRLYHQAIVPIGATDAGDPWGEILLRLLDETGNLILPGAFLPAVERYGQMDAIDRWVVGKALAALAAQIAVSPRTRYSVNVSGQSLHSEELLDFVIEQIDKAGIPPELIGFEITETAAIANLDAAQNFISTLKRRGCRIALDDFGSGLSSFTYLRTLPVDYLKIDASIISTMCRDPIDRAMVEGIHQISRVMGLRTIAEGVEDAATLEALKALGVNYAQGAWIAPPRALELTGGSQEQ